MLFTLRKRKPDSPATLTEHMELKLSRCSIRYWRPSDESALARHANNRNVWLNLRDAFPHPYTLADARMRILSLTAARPVTHFAIAINGQAIGSIGFHIKTDVYRRSAEIGYWLGEEFWGRGIATEALQAITAHAFKNFDLCRVYASVFAWNTASMRVLEKVGYSHEGTLKQSITKDGKTTDELIYAILKGKL